MFLLMCYVNFFIRIAQKLTFSLKIYKRLNIFIIKNKDLKQWGRLLVFLIVEILLIKAMI